MIHSRTEVKVINEKRKKLLLEESPYKAIPVIAAPLVLSMIVESVYNMADAYFVSSLGPSIVAAVGINDALMAYMKVIAMLFVCLFLIRSQHCLELLKR